jgi:hypothetical protein
MQSAETLGIEVERWEVRKADDLDRVFGRRPKPKQFWLSGLA